MATMAESDAAGQEGRRGFWASAALKLLTRHARVADIDDLAPGFRLISIAGDGLKGASWSPGHKIQIHMKGVAFRTYTPTEWDAEAGKARFLAYMHGDGPGARWAKRLMAGDECHIHGPRRSLDLAALAAPAVFVGDETSIGPAASMPKLGGATRFLFEVSSLDASREVLRQLGLAEAELIARREGDAHHAEMEGLLLRLAEQSGARSFALSGKAQTIQRLNRALRGRGIGSAQMKTKAYWAPGKMGLD